MSAYLMCEKDTNKIVKAMLYYKVIDESEALSTLILLVKENLKSLKARYNYKGNPDNSWWFKDSKDQRWTTEKEYISNLYLSMDEIRFKASSLPQCVALADIVGSYEYQSCEHPTWIKSKACKLTTKLYTEIAIDGFGIYNTQF